MRVFQFCVVQACGKGGTFLSKVKVKNVQPIDDPFIAGVVKLTIYSTPRMLRKTWITIPPKTKGKSKCKFQ